MLPDGPFLLYGAGREARSTRRFLKDTRPAAQVDVCVDTGTAEIENARQVEIGALPDAFRNGDYAMVIRSPGVSLYKDEIRAARDAHIPVTTNLNLWAEFRKAGALIVAITGTKGKSTTASLTHLMLEKSGVDAGLGGNIGVPPLELGDHDVIVLELSSFQCADIAFTPDIIGITSLYPEHLDWHKTELAYYRDKLNLIPEGGDYRFAAGPQAALHPQITARHIPIGAQLPALEPAFEDEIFDAIHASKLVGQHNLENAMLAARLARAAGATDEGIIDGITAFEPLPHRLEQHEIGGKKIVNDSIATTAHASVAALDAFAADRVALLIGGFDRGQDYSLLIERIAANSPALVVALPDTGARIAGEIGRAAPQATLLTAADIDEALAMLAIRKEFFDTVLLSPGAPSFNQFANYEERGRAFLEAARHHLG